MPIARCYTRVSTVEQATGGTSLDRQREELARYAASLGCDVAWYSETESGAGTGGEDRIEQRRLLADLRPGDVVVVAKQDRWSRDTRFFLASIDDEILAKGARFVSLAERFDPSTPEGRLTATIMSAVAEQERARIRDRTHGSRMRLRSLGLWVDGATPLGYRIENRRAVIVEEEAMAVRRMFALAAEGRSLKQIAERIANEFPSARGMHRSNIHHRLRDRHYLGEMPTEQTPGPATERRRWAGWKPAHEPIVTPEVFYAAQEAMKQARKGRPRGQSTIAQRFLLRSLLRCGSCTRLMQWVARPRETTAARDYYRCERCHASARRDTYDAEFEAQALAHLEKLRRHIARAVPTRQDVAPDFAATRARLMAQRARLVAAVMEGALPMEQVREKRETIDAGLAKVDAEEAIYRSKPVPLAPAECLERIEEIRDRWARATVPERNEIVRIVTKTVTLLRQEGAKKWARNPYTLAVTWKECALCRDTLTRGDETGRSESPRKAGFRERWHDDPVDELHLEPDPRLLAR